MKKLFLSIIIIISGIFIVDRIGAKAMWWVNQHTNENAGLKIRTMINDVNADVLLMGTSRCNRHYVPSIISDSIRMSVYNGGIDASDNIYAHYTLLNLILQRYKPKVICLEVSTNDFTNPQDPFSTVSFFAPYFGNNEQSDSIFHLAGLYWQYELFHLYRFNAKATSNIAGLLIAPQDVGKDGYVPSQAPAHFIQGTPTNAEEVGATDNQKVRFIQCFIDICKREHIKLIFTISPAYTTISSNHYSIIYDIAKRNGIPILDYHTKGIYHNHPEYFEDRVHLWHKGAILFSRIFASDLKMIRTNEDDDPTWTMPDTNSILNAGNQ